VRSSHSAVLYNNRMIVFGGSTSSGYLNDMYELNLDTLTWNEIQSKGLKLLSPRAGHTAVVYGNEMLVMGGQNKKGYHNKLYSFSFETQQWKKIKVLHKNTLPPKRAYTSALILSGFLYIFGGTTHAGTLNDLHVMKLSNVGAQTKSFVEIKIMNAADSSGSNTPSSSSSHSNANNPQHLVAETWFEKMLKSVQLRAIESNGKLYLIGGPRSGVQQISELLVADAGEFHKIMDVPFEELKLTEKIGQGTFREIYKGTWRGETVAIKLMRKESVKNDVLQQDLPSSMSMPAALPSSATSLMMASSNNVKNSNSSGGSNSFGSSSSGHSNSGNSLTKKSSSFKGANSASSLSPTGSFSHSHHQEDEQQQMIAKYIAEINQLRLLKHPNIIAFKCLSQSNEQIAIVTEYGDKNLGAFLHGSSPASSSSSPLSQPSSASPRSAAAFPAPDLDWEQKITLLLDIARGLHYLHSKNIVHGFLTPSNVLMCQSRAKLSDFFISAGSLTAASQASSNNHMGLLKQFLKEVKNFTFEERLKLLRTPYYLAPELLKDEPATKASDIYSFAIIMWELFTMMRPYDNSNEFMTWTLKIKQEEARPWSEAQFNLLAKAKKDDIYGNGNMDDQKKQFLRLMKLCWAQDPSDRIEIDKVIKMLRECSTKSNSPFAALSLGSAVEAQEFKVAKYEKLKLVRHFLIFLLVCLFDCY